MCCISGFIGKETKIAQAFFSYPWVLKVLVSSKAHVALCSMNNTDLFVCKVKQGIIFLSETIYILSSPARYTGQTYLESKQTPKCCVSLLFQKANIEIWFDFKQQKRKFYSHLLMTVHIRCTKDTQRKIKKYFQLLHFQTQTLS